MRTQQPVVIAIAIALAAGTVWAEGTKSSSSQSSGSQTTSAINKSIDVKDPVASAFRLPSGQTLTAQQVKAYEKLKTKYQSTLHEAIDMLHSKDSVEKNKGLKLNRETRAAIKAEIAKILAVGQNSPQTASSGSYSPQAAYPRPAAGACPCGRR